MQHESGPQTHPPALIAATPEEHHVLGAEMALCSRHPLSRASQPPAARPCAGPLMSRGHQVTTPSILPIAACQPLTADALAASSAGQLMSVLVNGRRYCTTMPDSGRLPRPLDYRKNSDVFTNTRSAIYQPGIAAIPTIHQAFVGSGVHMFGCSTPRFVGRRHWGVGR